MNARNWTLNAYTNDAWTTLVTDETAIDAVVIANTSGGAVNIQIRLADKSGTERAILVPTKSIAATTAETLDIAGLKTGKNDIIQVQASAAGVHFTASGREVE